jgi:hypothetical protein
VRSASQPMVTVTCGASPPVVGNSSLARGAFAHFDEGVGLARRHAAAVRVAVRIRAGSGEFLVENTEQATVLGVQPAFHREAPVAAIAQPQLTAGASGWERIVGWFRPVGIQRGGDALGNGPQPARVEISRVAGQISLGTVPSLLRHRGR